MFAEDETALLLAEAWSADELERRIERRIAGEPLEQVVGWAEFYGERIALDPGEFVPRHRTELLAAEAIRNCTPQAVVVDMCCGSGAIGRAVRAAFPQIELHAADIDQAAVRCATRNLAGIGVVHAGDLFDTLPPELRGRINVLTANTPYVPTAEITLLPSEARDHEPHVTLDGGGDGLDAQRRIAQGARQWLAPGGCLLVETGAHQVSGTVAAFEAGGLDAVVVTDDDLVATVVVGRAG